MPCGPGPNNVGSIRDPRGFLVRFGDMTSESGGGPALSKGLSEGMEARTLRDTGNVIVYTGNYGGNLAVSFETTAPTM